MPRRRNAKASPAVPDPNLIPVGGQKLHFFPESFPDETLLSRVSRYHLLSGESLDEYAWKALFGLASEYINFATAAPFALRALANRLPGQSRVTLGALLSLNSFVALVRPVMASIDWKHADPTFSETQICVLCAKEDLSSVGVTYIHRAHQLPGVKACWRHAIRLVDACPKCSRSFRVPGKFVAAPIVPCFCGWNSSIGRQPVQAAESEHKFAMNANRVFERRAYEASASSLIDFFELHIGQTGFSSKLGMEPTTSLSIGIAEQLEKNYSAAEVANAVSRFIHAGRAPSCWVANLNPGVLKARALRREGRDEPLIAPEKAPYAGDSH